MLVMICKKNREVDLSEILTFVAKSVGFLEIIELYVSRKSQKNQ